MKGPLPPLIDSHCHLTEPIYSGKEEEYLDRAYQAGVKGVVSVGIDIETSRKAIEQAERFPDVYATIGLHPHNASTIDVKALDELGELVSHEKVVAVGETGLDYHYDLSPRDLQRKAFAAQVILARKAHRPLVVHSREAVGDCLEVIAGYGGGEVKGVFHCFSGTESEAFDILKLGFYLSFAGNITFKGFDASYISSVPLERILLETDAPYLSPVPFRGKTNEPAYLVKVLEGLAGLLGDKELLRVAAHTTMNTIALFGMEGVLGGEFLYLLNKDID